MERYYFLFCHVDGLQTKQNNSNPDSKVEVAVYICHCVRIIREQYEMKDSADIRDIYFRALAEYNTIAQVHKKMKFIFPTNTIAHVHKIMYPKNPTIHCIIYYM